MRWLHARISVLIVCCSYTTLAPLPAWAQDKRTPTLTVIGPSPPASSLAEVWTRSPVVVRGIVEKTLAPQVDQSNKREVFRFQILRIEEVLKEDESLLKGRRVINVKQFGGTVSVEGRDAITEFPMPLLKEGEEAVLFISPLRGSDAFWIHLDSQGAFVVKDGTAGQLAVSQSAARLPELHGRQQIGKSELMQLLQGFRKNR